MKLTKNTFKNVLRENLHHHICRTLKPFFLIKFTLAANVKLTRNHFYSLETRYPCFTLY